MSTFVVVSCPVLTVTYHSNSAPQECANAIPKVTRLSAQVTFLCAKWFCPLRGAALVDHAPRAR